MPEISGSKKVAIVEFNGKSNIYRKLSRRQTPLTFMIKWLSLKAVDLLCLVLLCVTAPPHLVSFAQTRTTTTPPKPRTTTTTLPPSPPITNQSKTTAPGVSPKPSAGNKPRVIEDDDEEINITTDLVTLPVIVRQPQGQVATNLQRGDFRIYEDGRLQQLTNFSTTEAPFEVALLLDTSGSTRAEINLIRRAANAFVESLREGDKVAIVAFATEKEKLGSRAVVTVKQNLTADRAQLATAIESLETSNGTPFYDALETIGKRVFNQPPTPEFRGRRAIVALTDGVDSTSEAEFEEASLALTRRGVISYFVQINTETFVEDKLLQDCAEDGRLTLSRAQLQRYRRIFAPQTDAGDFQNFCQLGMFQRMQISRNLYSLARREMATLARTTGGKTFEAFDLRDARRAFALVAQEIGTQYSLGYYSTNKQRDGAFRRIRIEIPKLKNASIQTREGYNAPRG